MVVADNGKPTVRRKRRPQRKTLFERRLLQLERDINMLYRFIRYYKTQYNTPKPKISRKNS